MPRLRYRAPKSPSSLEARFLMLWKHVKGPDLEREYRFHHERRWRADFAHVGARVLIEIEGGIWVNGRHNRAAGFNADLEKYLAAGLAGWRVFRFGPDQITLENVERMAEQVRDEMRRFSTESTLVKNQQIVDSELLDANQAVKKVES
jgi:very-short-patch-repair endonuclease